MPGQLVPTSLTAKGQRSATRVLHAATVVLARDGFAGASLRAIAKQAGVDKRNVLYYFGSREALLVRVVQAVGERIAAAAENALADDAEGQSAVGTVIDALWDGITGEPELARAYIALLGGGAGSPEVDEALTAVKARYLQLLRGVLAVGDPASAEVDSLLWLAVLRGLLLEWTETGETPALRASLASVETFVGARST